MTKPVSPFDWKEYAKKYPLSMREESKLKQASQTLALYVEKKRKTNPTHGTMFGISDKATSVEPLKMMKGGGRGRKNDA
jgi:hypothetical protein